MNHIAHLECLNYTHHAHSLLGAIIWIKNAHSSLGYAMAWLCHETHGEFQAPQTPALQ